MKDVFPLLYLMPLVFNFAPYRGHRTVQLASAVPFHGDCNYLERAGDVETRQEREDIQVQLRIKGWQASAGPGFLFESLALFLEPCHCLVKAKVNE